MKCFKGFIKIIERFQILCCWKSTLEWTILDILHDTYPLSCDQAWTFSWPPSPPLLVHVVIEWPQTGSSSRSIWKHFNQFDKPIAMAVRARGWRPFACIAYSCHCSPPHQSCCLLLCRKDLSRKPSLSTRNSNSKEKRIKPF